MSMFTEIEGISLAIKPTGEDSSIVYYKGLPTPEQWTAVINAYPNCCHLFLLSESWSESDVDAARKAMRALFETFSVPLDPHKYLAVYEKDETLFEALVSRCASLFILRTPVSIRGSIASTLKETGYRLLDLTESES